VITGQRGRVSVPPLQPGGRVIAGVAAGIAAAVGVDPVVVRASFVVLAAAGGLGVLLYAIAWPPQGIYTKKQLNSTADMKGLKWRAYNPATTRIAQIVGAQPLTIQAAELSQALSTGVVDSFMSSGATGVDSKVWESLTHFATVDAWLPKNMVIINQKEFDKLDKATQDAVLAAGKAAEERGWKMSLEEMTIKTAALKAAGVTFEAHVYPGTRHGFHNNSTPRYNEAAAQLAWDRTLAHFRRHLAA